MSRDLLVLQSGGSHGGGNQLLLDEAGHPPALLKLYRRRGSALGEILKQLSYSTLERKRGVTAEQRCELERDTLALWRANGIDVPATLERALPAGSRSDTATWLEFCPGPLLSAVVASHDVEPARKIELIEQLAQVSGRRHALAEENADPRFLMENASIKHVIVCGDRLVHFDLETGYLARIDLLEALAQDVSTILRSLIRHATGEFRPLGIAYIRGYPCRERLARIALHGVRSSGLVRRVKRAVDRYRRESGFGKTDMLTWLERELNSEAASSRSY